MTTVAQQISSTAPTINFDPSNNIPIAALSPSPIDSSSYIVAQVALVWPYSSSTGTLALLLADPDIRRRKSKGQVKVLFRSGCAREVAKTKVGIGDVVRLALVGCEWNETGDVVSTPGKKIDWDLEYRRRVVLQILRENQETYAVDYTRDDPDSPTANGAISLVDSTEDIRPRLNGVVHSKASTIQVPYLTPLKSTRRPSGGNFDAAYFDPFLQDDGYILGRARKRTKFARDSGTWSFIDSTDKEQPARAPKLENEGVPEPQHEAADQTSHRAGRDGLGAQQDDRGTDTTTKPISSLQNEHTAAADTVETSSSVQHVEPIEERPARNSVVMGPPQTPRRPPGLQSALGLQAYAASEGSDATTTPRLHPLTSPGLLAVSPLVHRSGVDVGYFPQFDPDEAQLDASGARLNAGAREVQRSAETIEDDESLHSDDSLVIVEETSTQQQSVAQARVEPKSLDDDPLSQRAIMPEPMEHESVRDQPTQAQEPNNFIPENWLSSMEASITQELSHTELESSLKLSANRNGEIVEIEDDDLYGASGNVPKGNDSLSDPLSIGHPTSPLDVLDQFLQMSPVATARPLVGSDSDAFMSPRASTAPQQIETEVSSAVTLTERLTVAVDNRSPGTSAEPQSPLLQSQIYPEGSLPLNRGSSCSSQIQPLDGSVDERENFVEDQRQITTAATVTGALEVSKGLETGMRVPKEEIESSVFQREESGDESLMYTSPPVTTIAIPEDHSVHISTEEPGPTIHAPLSTAPTHDREARLQLPTPDPTQIERYSFEQTVETKADQVHDIEGAGLPSPHHTQEGPADVVAEDGQLAQAPEVSATSAVAATPNLEVDSNTSRRTSQRLSTRKTVMANNISSPYFTPRKGAQPRPSSPIPKENFNAADAQVHGPISSPIQEHLKQLSVHEVKVDVPDSTIILPISTDLEIAKPLQRQHTGTTTPLAYYPHLGSLHEHFGQLVDVIAVCTEPSSEPELSSSGPKDYHTTLRLADASSENDSATAAQVFRPAKNALPTAGRGEVVICRSFIVQTSRRKFMLLSTATSSWAVFKTDPNITGAWSDVVVSGPPIEYGLAETVYVKDVLRWWGANGENRFPTRPAMTKDQEKSKAASPPTKGLDPRRTTPRPSGKPLPTNRRKENVTDNYANEGDEAITSEPEEEARSPPLADKTNRRRASTISTAPSDAGKMFTPRRSARVNQSRSPSVVHELRNGTKYVDDGRRRSGSVVHELRDGFTYVDE